MEDWEEGGVWGEGCWCGWDFGCCSYCEGEGGGSGWEEGEDLFGGGERVLVGVLEVLVVCMMDCEGGCFWEDWHTM